MELLGIRDSTTVRTKECKQAGYRVNRINLKHTMINKSVFRLITAAMICKNCLKFIDTMEFYYFAGHCRECFESNNDDD
jgi:hypothetical protein